MDRRNSFKTVFGCIVATVVGRCVALAEVTHYYWPGHWSKSALRKHLISDSKHRFPASRVEDLTFQQLIDLHDKHHWKIGDRSRTPFPNGKQVPGTQKGRGGTSEVASPDQSGSMPKSSSNQSQKKRGGLFQKIRARRRSR